MIIGNDARARARVCVRRIILFRDALASREFSSGEFSSIREFPKRASAIRATRLINRRVVAIENVRESRSTESSFLVLETSVLVCYSRAATFIFFPFLHAGHGDGHEEGRRGGAGRSVS